MKHTGHATAQAGDLLTGSDGYAVLQSMRWRTPRALVDAAALYLGLDGFDLDACAEHGAHWAPDYYTAERSCLSADWAADYPTARSVWMNPPYGAKCVPRKTLTTAGHDAAAFEPFPGIGAFIEAAADWATSGADRVACLCVPSSFESGRFGLYRRAAEFVMLGRVKFSDIDGNTQRNPPGAHMLVIFRSSQRQPRFKFGLPGFGFDPAWIGQ